MSKPVVKTLPNGLRIVHERPANHSQITNLQLFCHVGSIHEPWFLNGAAHFIEHMCFKGSSQFPSYNDVSKPFSQSASYFNAETTKQYTQYKINCAEDHVAEFLTILGDIVLRSKFDKAEYKKERNVVREETLLKSPPKSYIEDLVFAGTDYGRCIDLDIYHLEHSLPYDPVVEFYHNYYVPQNMVLSILSPISTNTLLKYLAKTAFAKQMSVPPQLNGTPSYDVPEKKEQYKIRPNGLKTTSVEIGFRVCDQFDDDDIYTLNVLKHILGCSASSRLFIELREKRGLTYTSSANMQFYEIGGIFYVFAICDTKRFIHDGKLPGLFPTLCDVLEKLIKHGVTESEIRWAKQRIHDTFQNEQLVGEDKCAYNGVRLMLHNETDILTTEEMYEKCYKSIDKKRVNDIIKKYFSMDKAYLSVYGGNLPPDTKILKYLYPKTKP